MKIVFMGTPDFAVGILDKLVQQQCEIVGVVTAPDKPSGRGQQLGESAVKKYAAEKGLPILQPSLLKDEQFLSRLRALQADLFVVVAFRMLPEVVWQMPPKGTINLHASLLPQYRGAAPINWALIHGEKESGVSTFFIEKEIDTGLVIEQAKISIDENETAGELHDRLMNLGRELVYSTVIKIEQDKVTRIPQEQLSSGITFRAAPKIFKPMCQINWKKDARTIHNLVRGLSPYPTAWTILKHKTTGETKSLKIFRTEITDLKVGEQRILVNKNELYLAGEDFYLKILELQVEGKRKMTPAEFLAGNKVIDFDLILRAEDQ